MYNLSLWPSPGSHQQQGLFSYLLFSQSLQLCITVCFAFFQCKLPFVHHHSVPLINASFVLLLFARFFHTTSLIHSPFSQSSSPLSADVKTGWVRVSKQNLRQSWTVSKSCTFIARLCFSFLMGSWTSWSPFIISFPEQASIQKIPHSSQHLHISIWVQDSRFLQKLSR